MKLSPSARRHETAQEAKKPIFAKFSVWEFYDELSSHVDFNFWRIVLMDTFCEDVQAILQVHSSINIYRSKKKNYKPIIEEEKHTFYVQYIYTYAIYLHLSLAVFEIIKPIGPCP